MNLEPVEEILWRDQHRGPRGKRRPEITDRDVE